MRKFIPFLCIAVLLCGVIGCGKANKADEPAPTSQAAEPTSASQDKVDYVVGTDVNGNEATQYDPENPAATFPPENIISGTYPPETAAPASTPAATAPGNAAAPNATATPEPFEDGQTAGSTGDDFSNNATVIDFEDLFGEP
jgi:hypothetical protein